MSTTAKILIAVTGLLVVGAIAFAIFGPRGSLQSVRLSERSSDTEAQEDAESVTEKPEEATLAWDGKWIDTHTHPTANVVKESTNAVSFCFEEECLNRLTDILDRYGIEKTVLFYPPSSIVRENVGDRERALAEAVQKHPDRLVYGAGGWALNPLIQRFAGSGTLTDAMKTEFEDAARQLAKVGAHVFGETTALHISLAESHPFEQVSPDNELYLLLADLAAEYDIPIDIHMDPVFEDMPLPSRYTSSRNPDTLQENMVAFERLLAHNPDAIIVWVHVGRNNLGTETADLFRRLLGEYTNLYIQMAVVTRPGNSILDENQKVHAEWLELMEEYPDRFVLGSDTFYGASEVDEKSIGMEADFLRQLPGWLAQKIGTENPKRIYHLE